MKNQTFISDINNLRDNKARLYLDFIYGDLDEHL